MKNNIKHPHFRRKLEYYLKGLIAGEYKLREVAAHTGYTIFPKREDKLLSYTKGSILFQFYTQFIF